MKHKGIGSMIVGVVLLGALLHVYAQAEEEKENMQESIVLGGGCFWCLDPVFAMVPGVESVVVGYSGGKTKNPDYRAVCTGRTGHAEVLQVQFDPDRVALSELLDLFWKMHDPTTLNRQGADVGTQYRSVIFYTNETQKHVVEASVKKAQEAFRDPIVTEVAPLDVFYAAEDYHQDYFANNPHAGYCQMVIAPKVRKAKQYLSE